MIAKMSAVTILTTANRRRYAINALRECGMLHVEQNNSSQKVSSAMQTRLLNCQKALQLISHYKTKKRQRAQQIETAQLSAMGEDYAHQIINYESHIQKITEDLLRINRDIDKLRPWGNFRHATLERLEENGIYVSFFIAAKNTFKSIPKKKCYVIHKRGVVIYFVLISRNAKEHEIVGIDPIYLPEHDLSALMRRREICQQEIRATIQKIAQISQHEALIEFALQRLIELNRLVALRNTFKWSGQIISINGFIPVKKIPAFKAVAKKSHWGITISEPYPTQTPPTKIENGKPIAIITPLYNLLGTVPGYREPDISVVFLLFFVIFFAMIVGDGGYALLLIGAALIYRLRARKQKVVAHLQSSALLLVVGVATLCYGAISGNWFGHAPIAQDSFLQIFVIPQINAFEARSISFVQWICFIIATIHLSIARIWKFLYVYKYESKAASIAQFGWLFVVWSLYSLVVRLILAAFNYWHIDNTIPLFIAGFALIIVFGQQRQNQSFFKGVGRGLASIFNTVLDSVSAFADVISYLRLFAVGLASVEIARSFNQIATNLFGDIIGTVGGVVLLIIGHTLNIAMGALSLIVHGVRLNMLEFSSHLGVEWSGVPYRPFKKETALVVNK